MTKRKGNPLGAGAWRLSKQDAADIKWRVGQGESKAALAREYKVSRQTIGYHATDRDRRVPLITFPFVRSRVLAALLSTDSAKAGAAICGISHRSFCRFVNKLGYRRMYVTAAERAAITKSRGEAQKAA